MIFTFYSYKGGVGRSMAMASVAHLLARRGLKVLAIDFDLEAPGLERYFFDTERSRSVRAQPGLLDLILAYREALSNEAAFASGEFKRWQNFRLTAIGVAGTLGGSVDLMTAGRREPESAKRDYSLAVRSFDWQDFFHNWKGDLFFDWLRRQLRSPETGYDVVLVDSRTGVTEMGGVCAYQLADVAVLLCAPNYQNLDGTLDVVRDFRSDSVRALRRGRPLEILTLPARVEANHPGRAAFLALFKSQLGVEGLPAVLAQAGLDYEKLALPYLPQFAVAEQLVGEAPKNPLAGVSDVFECLADALTLLAEPDTPLGRYREDALRRLTGGGAHVATELVADTTRSSAGYDAFIDYSPADLPRVQELVDLIEGAGCRSFFDREGVETGQAWQSVVEQALAYSSVLLVCFGQATNTEFRARIIAHARRLQTVKIIPVLLPGSDEHAPASFDLGQQQTLDLRDWNDTAARERLLRAVSAASQPEERAAPTAPERDPYPGARAFTEDDAAFFFGREQETTLLLDTLRTSNVVLITGAAQIGKTSLLQAGLLPRLRRMAESDPLRFGAIYQIPLSDLDAAGWREPEHRGEGARLWLVDGIDSFDQDGSAEARARRLGNLQRLLAQAGHRLKIVLVARDSLPAEERAGMQRLMHECGAAVVEVQPLASSALAVVIEEPARRAGHLLEPGLAQRLVESAGAAVSAVAQIELALATIWPERKRGWLTNKNLDAAGHLEGIMTRRRRVVLGELSPAERDTARVLFSRLIVLSSTYAAVTAPQPWDTLATMPALKRMDAVALRDKLAAGGIIDLYNVAAVAGPASRSAGRELQVALARADVSVYLADDVTSLDLPFRLWRGPVSGLAWRWDGSNADALLRGSALAEAQHWLAEREDQLTANERAFIDASTAAQEAEIRNRQAQEEQERAAREAREKERLQAAEALAAERGERLSYEQLATQRAVQYVERLKRGQRRLVGLLGLAAVLAGIAIYQTVQEQAAAQLARSSEQEAQSALQTARAEKQSAEVAALRAREALDAVQTTLTSASEARDAAQAALEARTDQARLAASSQLQAANETYRQASVAAANLVRKECPVGRRVYLHISQESDREGARALIAPLEKQGFIVPGIELVRGTPQTSDVRYFRASEEAAASQAARVLRESGVANVTVKLIPGYENSTQIRPCHYEAWLTPGGLPRFKR